MKLILLLLDVLYRNTLLRIYSILLYPVSYYLRDSIRTQHRLDYSKQTNDRKLCLNHNMHWLWCFLDDSIFISYDREYNIKEGGKGSLKDSGDSFLKAYYWSVLRNSSVNYANWYALGNCLSQEYIVNNKYFRVTNSTHERGNGVRLEHFFYIPLNVLGLKGWYRLDIGHTTGNGRVETKVRKVD